MLRRAHFESVEATSRIEAAQEVGDLLAEVGTTT